MPEVTGPASTTADGTTTTTAWLLAHGRRPWAEVRSLLDGCTCAWADLDGFHCNPSPADPPLASHLWAWDTGRLLRVRIDGSYGITAELRLTDPGQGEPVTVTERAATTWRAGEGRVSAAPEWRGRNLHVYEVTGLMPLEFTRLEEPDPTARPAGNRHADSARATGQ